MKDTPKMSLVSISTLSDKYKVGGAVARQAMRDLLTKKLIVRVGDHNASTPFYRGASWSLKKDAEDAAAAAQAKGNKGQKAKKEKAAAKEEAEEVEAADD